MHRRLLAAVVAATALVVPATTASAEPNNNNVAKLTKAVTVAGIHEHLDAFQAIADANGGNRFAGRPATTRRRNTSTTALRAAGYDVTSSRSQYDAAEDLSVLTSAPGSRSGRPTPAASVPRVLGDAGLRRQGDITAPLVRGRPGIPRVGGSTSGCEAADFAGFPAGPIALVQRGTCDFIDKVNNAADAGACAVIIFNEGNAPTRRSLDFNPIVAGDDPGRRPTFAAGVDWPTASRTPPPGRRSTLKVAFFAALTTRNVIADRRARSDGQHDRRGRAPRQRSRTAPASTTTARARRRSSRSPSR